MSYCSQNCDLELLIDMISHDDWLIYDCGFGVRLRTAVNICSLSELQSAWLTHRKVILEALHVSLPGKASNVAFEEIRRGRYVGY